MFDDDHGSVEPALDRSTSSLTSKPVAPQVTAPIKITSAQWACKCLCCCSMRCEYANVAHQQIYEVGKIWESRCEVLMSQNASLVQKNEKLHIEIRQLYTDLFDAKAKIESLEELKEWRDFTNLGGNQ